MKWAAWAAWAVWVEAWASKAQQTLLPKWVRLFQPYPLFLWYLSAVSGRSIVVGAGIAGAFVALQFARQGLQVTLMDAEGIPNMDSPSAGDTRVFRMAYFEAPEYVPFLKSAKEEWLELAGESDVPIFEECGVLMVGAEDSDLIQGGEAVFGGVSDTGRDLVWC